MPEVPEHTPALVSWNLTRRCNLACPHCYLDAGTKADDELTTDECLALVDELHGLGTEMLILTGGEPLLRRDIYAIARRASDLGLWVVMGTNGVLVNDHVAARMVECGVRGVGISLDALDPDRHNAFRGGPDAWKYSVRALDLCRRHGLEVLVQTTVMEENYDEIPALIDFARERGAWAFNLYFLVRTGRGRTMTELSPERTHAMLEHLARVQDRYRPMLVRAKCAPQFKQIAHALGLAGLESGGCMAGTEYCRITPGGDVTPCPYMDVVAGNVRVQSFTEIWRTSPVFADLRAPDRLGGRCGTCEFRHLCGGCRCRAHAATGDYLAEDPACTYRPTGIPLDTLPLAWSDAARARLERIPIAFIRDKVRRGVEAYARGQGVPRVTSAVVSAALNGADRPAAFRHLSIPPT